MGRHATSLPNGDSLPSAYGLPNGAVIILGGVTWYVDNNNWKVGGGGTDATFDPSKAYAPGASAFVAGDLYVATSTTVPGPFDSGYWTKVSSLFDAKGVWDTSDPDNLPYSYAGGVYQHDGKLWRCISPDISTSQDPSTTAVEPARAAWVQVSGYGGTAAPIAGAYLAFELIIEDITRWPLALIHRATGISVWRSYPLGEDWEPTDTYRLVKKADFTAAQAAHGSLLDIPTVTTLSIDYVANGTESGDRSARLAFSAPIDLAPSSNPDSEDYETERVQDRYVLITDRMDLANFMADGNATRVNLDFGWLMVFGSADLDDVTSSTDAFPALEITTDVPAWQLVFDPTL